MLLTPPPFVFLSNLAVATATLILFGQPAFGADRVWNEPAGGDFPEAENWVDDLPPGTNDTAIFNLPDAYTVNFDDDAETFRLRISNGDVTFDLGGNTYLLNDNDRNNTAIIGDLTGNEEVRFTILNGMLDAFGTENRGSFHVRGDGINATTIIGEGGHLRTTDFMTIGDAAGAIGTMIVQDGALVEPNRLIIGTWSVGGGEGLVRVTGADSRIRPESDGTSNFHIEVGRQAGDRATLIIEDNGVVDSNASGKSGNRSMTIGTGAGSHGKVVVTRDGLFRTVTKQITMGHATDHTGSAVLHISNGGQVVSSADWEVRPNALIDIRVTGNQMLQISGGNNNLANNGMIWLAADPRLGQGTYTPITLANSDGWIGTGSFQTFGGVWNNTEREFIVNATETVSEGNNFSFDLTAIQRLQIDGNQGETLLVAFDPDSEAGTGGSSINFEASVNSTQSIGGFWPVLAAWDVTTDLAAGSPAILSMDVGSGWDVALFAWHSPDGVNWNRLDTEVFLEGDWASFQVNGFSSYALTIPEPSTAVLVLLGGLAALGIGRCRR